MSKLEKKKELQKLIATGKEKGFLTYEEINEALPEEVTESEELDEVMALIEENDIEIVENEKQLKLMKKATTAQAEAADEEEALARGLDPVRLYLKKMGSVALLTREGEIEIAKRIEEGEAEVLDVILNSSMGIKEFLAIGEKIEKGKLRARDVVRGGEGETEAAPETEEGAVGSESTVFDVDVRRAVDGNGDLSAVLVDAIEETAFEVHGRPGVIRRFDQDRGQRHLFR